MYYYFILFMRAVFVRVVFEYTKLKYVSSRQQTDMNNFFFGLGFTCGVDIHRA